jgi:hypothetical protein
MASKRALKTVRKSYKEVLLSQGRMPTQKVPPPEELARLLLTPRYQDLRNRLFGFFLIFLVQTEVVGKQEAGEIMNFWQEKNLSETPGRH